MKVYRHLAVAVMVVLAGGLSAPAVAGTDPSWAIQYPPDRSGAGNELSGVSCSSPAACSAVGYSSSSSGRTVTLAERWNGTTWAIQSTPNANPSGGADSLTGVSCPSATACTAVGYYFGSSGRNVPLAERWNGTSWAIQSTPIPNPSGGGSDLTGVSCSSATACTAVGYYYDNSGGTATLAERWNGATWTIQSTPNAKGVLSDGDGLTAVSCSSATACTAVGPGAIAAGATLAERWNGTKWVIQSTPNPSGARNSNLFGVSCPSATACTATGTYENSSDAYLTLAERWNGTGWVIQSTPTPPPADKYSDLAGVSCSSATACTAVGVGNSAPTLAERWNGTKWVIQSTPNPPSGAGDLFGVSCPSATACIAAGDYVNSSLSNYLTLAEYYS